MEHVKTLETVIAATVWMDIQAVTVRQKSMSVTQLPARMVPPVGIWLDPTVVSVPKVSRAKIVSSMLMTAVPTPVKMEALAMIL